MEVACRHSTSLRAMGVGVGVGDLVRGFVWSLER